MCVKIQERQALYTHMCWDSRPPAKPYQLKRGQRLTNDEWLRAKSRLKMPCNLFTPV